MGTALIRKVIFTVVICYRAPLLFVLFFLYFFFLRSLLSLFVGSPSDPFSLSRPCPSTLFPACHFPSNHAAFCPPRPLFSLALRGTLDISCVGPTLTQPLPVFTFTTLMDLSSQLGAIIQRAHAQTCHFKLILGENNSYDDSSSCYRIIISSYECSSHVSLYI